MQKRIFNRTGYNNPDWHYTINPQRGVEEEIDKLIRNKEYYLLHAPRQSGKTTLLHSLMRTINAKGEYISLVFSLESAGYRSINESEANFKIINSLYKTSIEFLEEVSRPEPATRNVSLYDYLNDWSKKVSKPLVLFIDEADSLYDDIMISVLRQLRNGFQLRPNAFPQSIALVGLRDIRDYKMKVRNTDGEIGSGSPFNIKAESFRLQNFTYQEVAGLYQQYTDETGQVFEPDVVSLIHKLTGGQPWLVNAIAHEITQVILNQDYSQPITIEIVERAKENLILRRDTHLDSLIDKLDDLRIKPIISGIISGYTVIYDRYNNDQQYILDLGIIKETDLGLKISNVIYEEIITRLLSKNFQDSIKPLIQSQWFIKPDGKLDLNNMLKEFQKFYRRNSESWINRFHYKECGHQLLLMAFLQRVINGGGRIEREMAAGSGRTDLCIYFAAEVFVLELKVKRTTETIEEGQEQLSRYLDTLGQDHGWLIVFEDEPSTKVSWEERIKWTEIDFDYLGKTRQITLVEM